MTKAKAPRIGGARSVRSGLRINFKTPQTKKFQRHIRALAFRGKLENALRVGMRRAVAHVRQKIITRIERGGYKKLATLTKLLRQGQSDTPLIDRRVLKRSIKTELIKPDHGRVGLLANNATSSKRSTFRQVGPLLHEGGVVKIDREKFMRFLGARGLLRDTGSGGGSTSLSSQVVIRIPKRPFISDVFEDSTTLREIQKIFMDAVGKAVRGT